MTGFLAFWTFAAQDNTHLYPLKSIHLYTVKRVGIWK